MYLFNEFVFGMKDEILFALYFFLIDFVLLIVKESFVWFAIKIQRMLERMNNGPRYIGAFGYSWTTSVTECSCNSGVLGGAPRSSLPGEFQIHDDNKNIKRSKYIVKPKSTSEAKVN